MESRDYQMEEATSSTSNVTSTEEGFVGHPDTWFDGKEYILNL
jgi:hypothetical protein